MANHKRRTFERVTAVLFPHPRGRHRAAPAADTALTTLVLPPGLPEHRSPYGREEVLTGEDVALIRPYVADEERRAGAAR